MARTFRPWGLLTWLLPKLPAAEWSFLGGASTEDRSSAAWDTLRSSVTVGQKLIIKVVDPPSRYSSITTSRSDLIRIQFLAKGIRREEIIEHELFVRVNELVGSIETFKSTAAENVVFDISALPKRFFFPILRLLIETQQLRNILVTYTVPQSYASGALSEDPEPWRHIPLFAPPYPEKDVRLLIVGLGFEPLALPDLLEADYHGVSVKLLFPFPPGPPSFQRTWEFVRTIEDNLPQTAREPIRVDARDVSAAFDQIKAVTDDGKEHAALGPYGPKTLSLAMCIYAILAKSPVYYTQPRVYNPFYSSGISLINGNHETYGYCLRIDGRDLFDL